MALPTHHQQRVLQQQSRRPFSSSQAFVAPRPVRTTRVRAAQGEEQQAAQQAARRGVIILPGLGNNAADYDELSALLRARGLAVAVAGVSRLDWSRNAAALTQGAWWRGTLKPRPAVDWYLERVDAAMQQLKREVDGAPISVLTHSAGGWLGRTYLLEFGATGVDRFVSLGSPHLPPPAGVIDQTRGILTWINDSCPGAHHETITYTTVAGRFVKGVDPLSGDGTVLARIAGAGYRQVCGEAEVDGDFIVPLPAAHLPGATNIDLDGVFHSPLGQTLPVFGGWYGSKDVLPRWISSLDDAELEGDGLGAQEAVPAAATTTTGLP